MSTIDPPWNIKNYLLAEEHIGSAAAQILHDLRAASDDDRLSFLSDSRAVHRALFEPLTPDGYAAYAGTYRGETGSVLEHRRAAIHYKNVEGLKERYPALHPSEVIVYMDRLGDFITEMFLSADNLGDGDYFSRMARVFGMFSKIHPYLDGNGHISRIMMIILAERKQIPIHPCWTVHPRPYGLEISIALEHYKICPVLLEQTLKLWFEPLPKIPMTR